ncbi:unnamed protein product [Caenorhabditis auriculariae]|uniref:Uncharacterized protein n=1 Tax=Caenorhabditis auriculariae TaxID=2777116 RepID=A0A8S1HQ80_9PELO|nr:unnamed protein product [Caenorhabditis auriculariae]
MMLTHSCVDFDPNDTLTTIFEKTRPPRNFARRASVEILVTEPFRGSLTAAQSTPRQTIAFPSCCQFTSLLFGSTFVVLTSDPKRVPHEDIRKYSGSCLLLVEMMSVLWTPSKRNATATLRVFQVRPAPSIFLSEIVAELFIVNVQRSTDSSAFTASSHCFIGEVLQLLFAETSAQMGAIPVVDCTGSVCFKAVIKEPPVERTVCETGGAIVRGCWSDAMQSADKIPLARKNMIRMTQTADSNDTVGVIYTCDGFLCNSTVTPTLFRLTLRTSISSFRRISCHTAYQGLL